MIFPMITRDISYFTKSLVFLLFIFIFVGCSKKIIVQADQIKPVDLNRFKTFKFIEDGKNPNLAFNEANQERIKLSIANELNSRNFIESELADFEISILGGIEMARESNINYHYPGYYPYYYPYHYYYDRHPENSNDSALIINIFDNGELVWQGVATGDFRPRKKQHIEVTIAEIVRNIFKEFPYQSEQ